MKTYCCLISFCLFIIVIGGFTPKVVAEEHPTYRIINGQSSVTGAWPSMVSLMRANTPPDKAHICGGILLNSSYVLTAGHCVADFIKTPRLLKVVIGRTRLLSSEGAIIGVDKIIIHPAFIFETSENDIALVHLRKPVLTNNMQLISPSQEQFYDQGAVATILGWGVTDADYPIRPDNLQQASIPIVGNNECQERLGLDFKLGSMICAGTLASSPTAADGVDACGGDSGGPLLINTTNGWKIAGITSWGYRCGSNKYWGVYTNVGVFYDWINSHPVIRPYSIRVPKIVGKARLGATLHCHKGTLGGDPANVNYEWRDNHGNYLTGGSRKSHYHVRRSEIKKSIVCKISAQNSAGVLRVSSQKFGPIIAR